MGWLRDVLNYKLDTKHHIPPIPSFNDFQSGVDPGTVMEEDKGALPYAGMMLPGEGRKGPSDKPSGARIQGVTGIPERHPDQPWRDVFDPNYNPKMGEVQKNKNFYDHVEDPKKSATTWDYIIQAQDVAERTGTKRK